MKWNPALYDKSHSFVLSYGEDLLALLNPKDGEKILDLGCGTGEIAVEKFRSSGNRAGNPAAEIVSFDRNVSL